MSVRIRVDLHEDHRLRELLSHCGADIDVGALPVGDYDLGRGVLVERKSVRDLHLTLVNGRLWRQLGLLRRHSTWPLLLVEGVGLDRGPVHENAVLGALVAAADQGIAVMRSNNREDSARWLIAVARRVQQRRCRYRPRFAQIPKSPRDDVPSAVLAAVPGISSVTARKLLDRFGSVAAIASASKGEVIAVAGVGERRYSALVDALHGRLSSPSRSEGPDPST